VTVRRDLYAMAKTASQVINKLNGAFRVTLPYKPARHKLRIRIDCYPCPYITETKRVALLFGNVLRFCVAKLPDLIQLQPTARKIAKGDILKLAASMADLGNERQYCIEGCAGQPRSGTNRISFD
jgi:hypothetical protein